MGTGPYDLFPVYEQAGGGDPNAALPVRIVTNAADVSGPLPIRVVDPAIVGPYGGRMVRVVTDAMAMPVYVAVGTLAGTGGGGEEPPPEEEPPPPSWSARTGNGSTALVDADFGTNNYWFNGAAYATTALWLAAIGGTFSRASTAVRRTSSGAYESVAAGVLRLDHSAAGAPLGYLNEGARTNKVTCAKNNPSATTNLTLVNASNGLATLTVVDDNTALTAAGCAAFGPNVYKLDNSAGNSEAYVTVGGNTGNTNPHSGSVFWRGSGSGHLRAASGVAGTNAAIPADYTRTFSENKAPTGSTNTLRITAAAGAVIYFIVPQLEEAGFSSSPIIGGAVAVTRSGDVLSIGPTGGVPFTGWSTTEGSIIFNGTGSNRTALSIDDGTTNESITFFGNKQVVVNDAGVPQATLGTSNTATTTFGIGFAFKLNDFAYSLGGGAVSTDTSGTLPTVTAMHLGRRYNGNELFGHISRLTYFPQRLPNADLQTLST